MKQAGKVSILTLIVICAVFIGAVILVAFSSADSPETAATKFMTALATNNVDRLTKLSFMGNEPAESVRKQWDFAVNQAAPYYRFTYRITGSSQPDPTEAAVKIEMVRNAGSPAAYPEDLEIPLVKRGANWLIDVRSMDKTIFPDMPK